MSSDACRIRTCAPLGKRFLVARQSDACRIRTCAPLGKRFLVARYNHSPKAPIMLKQQQNIHSTSKFNLIKVFLKGDGNKFQIQQNKQIVNTNFSQLGALGEWLYRATRNRLPRGAQVRILQASL
ncbi:hypothetical protein PPERSA_09439 [Pseudocohnilembus persalinus]|uniref:Uncharacterized protein n=1 Tax=Pseudocohnilembus persalinus TaxID=266149 RepID=A0A0V0Q9P8_PSEPJ|nr:hypothetical protein PPERSA_09439 [Pseudocohnilembus persalinus]|eukprot:KRW98914.1 hypothetical protein PPERSA_09439 [Pseudocohnilembus persalinus]